MSPSDPENRSGPLARAGRLAGGSLNLLAAAILFFLMVLTCVDVVGRYLFNSAVLGGLEMTEMAMAVLIFAGLPLITVRREQITIDLLDQITPGFIKPLQRLSVDLIAIFCLSMASWQLWLRAERLAAGGDVTAQLRIPLAPAIYLMAVLAAAAALALLFAMLRQRNR